MDENGYGLRVPGIVISPYARQGVIDHQVLSFDAYAKFIEDRFLRGQRLDPTNDGRPDPRPGVRENAAQLGDLLRRLRLQQAAAPTAAAAGAPEDRPGRPGRQQQLELSQHSGSQQSSMAVTSPRSSGASARTV